MEVVYTDVGMVPSFPQYTWQKISLGLLKGLRFSDNVVIVAQR
jgi:hypothetical protein